MKILLPLLLSFALLVPSAYADENESPTPAPTPQAITPEQKSASMTAERELKDELMRHPELNNQDAEQADAE